MAESDETFVSRWSRRKRGGPQDAAPVGPKPAPPAGPRGQAASPPEGEPPDLPDPDTLDADADFTVFLKENVPEAIRRRALRRLWRLNPVLANLDGLNDYDDDYTDAATVVAGLKTLYKVGRGFVTDEEEDAEAAGEESGEKPDRTETQAAEAGAPDQVSGEVPSLDPGADPGEASGEDPGPTVTAAVVPGAAPRPAAPRPGERRRGAVARRWGGAQD